MRYIDAHKLRKAIKKHEIIDKGLALTLVNSMVTEDTEHQSEWVILSSGKYMCKECCGTQEKHTQYCSKCGARMEWINWFGIRRIERKTLLL